MKRFLALLALLPAIAFAGKEPVYTARFSDLAVEGYDVTSFFEGTPVRGSAQFEHEHLGAVWRFTSAANRQKFIDDPEKYSPQYGGYCAWAAAQGYTAKGDPEHYSVVDGKLYLNFNASVHKRWLGDVPGFIQAANDNWPALLD